LGYKKSLLYFQKALFMHPRKEGLQAMERKCFVEVGDENVFESKF
jgi:hypothetical protein